MARNRLLLGFIACQKYRLKHPSLPANWKTMIPDCLSKVPGDPFSEKPLQLRRKQDGLLLYSIGENLKDDNGYGPILNKAARKEESWDSDTDICIKVYTDRR